MEDRSPMVRVVAICLQRVTFRWPGFGGRRHCQPIVLLVRWSPMWAIPSHMGGPSDASSITTLAECDGLSHMPRYSSVPPRSWSRRCWTQAD